MKRILIFGSTGAGKTSLATAMTGQAMEVSDSATGCTFKTVKCEPVEHNGFNYQFFDTTGLNEADGGTVPSKAAVKNLLDFVKTSDEGFNAFIFVFMKGRINIRFEKNDELFVKVIAQNKIPVIGVVTHCEEGKTLDTWLNKYSCHLEKYKFNELIGTCFKVRQPDMNPMYEKIIDDLRDKSVQRVFTALEKHALAEPQRIFDKSWNGLKNLIKNVWNFFCDFYKLYGWKWVNQTFYELLVALGFSADDAAKEAANEKI